MAQWGAGHLAKPEGLFWDQREILGVTDSENQCFCLFSGTGEIIFDSKTLSADAPKFIHPIDLVIFNEFIYVLDAAKACIQVYHFQRIAE